MKPHRHANYCGQCQSIFYSTSDSPERCSRCDSFQWYKDKKYVTPHQSLFGYDLEDDAY